MAHKNRWEMTQEERDRKDKKTTLKAFFIVLPSMFVGFFITFLLTDLVWKSFNYQQKTTIGQLPLIFIVGVIIFSIGYKIFKKFGILE